MTEGNLASRGGEDVINIVCRFRFVAIDNNKKDFVILEALKNVKNGIVKIMINLDNQKEIEKFDEGKILASIRMLPDQMEQAWEEIKNIDLPKECYSTKNVVICGMGGSALGGRIVDSLLTDRVRVPIEIFNQYDVPNYVDKNSFVIVSSYSGNTEETVSAAHKASAKHAIIFGITTGGKLAKFLENEKLPSYVYNPKANPSGQPRMGLGYSIAATLSLLSKCSFVHITDDDFYELVVTTRKFIKEFDIDIATGKNIAKSLSKQLYNKAPILIASSHLVGVVHAFKNQLNENSKVFSTLFELPELNHHLLEGLKFPAKIREVFHFLFFSSALYGNRVKKRYKITAEVIEKNGLKYSVYHPRSDTRLSQIFEVLALGSFISFYLALLQGVNPNKIPWVDYFKEQLAKS